ncbi:uncharacterized protein I206_101465 [Kwoniella pini CBS 10737]|uniref:Exoribonuclease phosphorolytic domain-containing protein n=1 Tax=Kwoniella pini CBS 10737 TaxID=1296096 RepID=A0A1B9HWN8_9TREE|nr:uncharacterized protein I206_06563 [Kwoniella pini CBS 10737]OCF47658.1 hypothetical protein I206_06563 [Kwoniella pini CBS 10737]
MSNAGPSRRYDGRRYDQYRPLQIEIGELDRADGSGRFGFGSTAALASCSGPLEVRLNKELPTRATLEISHRPLEGVGATPSRALVTTLESIFPTVLSLSSYPRSLIQLIVQSLSSSSTTLNSSTSSNYNPDIYIDIEPDNNEKNVWPQFGNKIKFEDDKSPNTSYPFSIRSTSINSITLACLDNSSIKMINLPISISISYLINKGLIIDPTIQEENQSSSRFGFAWSFGKNIKVNVKKSISKQDLKNKMDIEGEEDDNNNDQVEMELVWVESEGKFTKEIFSDALELSKIACRKILDEIRSKLGEKLENRKLQ